jgi:hypothetical protein
VRHLVDFMKSTQRGVSTAPRRGSVDELKVRECE